jgi:L-fucose mutarotase/ribose pyranase (RbsD/FucU family)
MATTSRFLFVLFFAAFVGLPLGGPPTARSASEEEPAWRELLNKRLAAFGHRNWIVIADAAYPAHSQAGIDTFLTGADQLQVVKVVLEELGKTRHVRPVIYLDAELPYVEEEDAPGVSRYRDRLKTLLGRRKTESLAHEQIIERLGKAGEKFQVLILKTNLAIPYTSVFIELDCGYWSPEAEQRLRKAFRGDEKKP